MSYAQYNDHAAPKDGALSLPCSMLGAILGIGPAKGSKGTVFLPSLELYLTKLHVTRLNFTPTLFHSSALGAARLSRKSPC